MAFGIPNSEPVNPGEFLGRIQYDARVGFWQVVKRAQAPDGTWGDEKGDPFKGVSFLVDFGSIEVGYLKLTSPPAFLVVPEGQPIPPQPQEMQTDAQGKQRKSYQPGFRVRVMSPKTFGDKDAYYFSNSSKTVLAPMDELYSKFKASPEAASGKVPVVQVNKTQALQNKTPQGTSTFYAPVFEITGWADRPDGFGPRTVAPPALNGHAHAPPAAPAPKPSNHVPPPAPKPAPAPVAAMPAFDDEIPF